MDDMEFLRSLNYDDGLETVTALWDHWPMQYAATHGTDGTPMIRPIEYKFEKDGVLYFDTVTYYSTYKELQAYPYIKICIDDQKTMSYLTVTGKVNFTDDADIIERCFKASPVLTSQFGNHRDVVIAYYLTEVKAEFNTFAEGLENHSWQLKNKYDIS